MTVNGNAMFNLLNEPWIKVITKAKEEKLVSLTDAFIHGHEYLSLAGETPLQDNAILRFLIAISVTIMYRYDIDGNEISLRDRDDALKRFRKIWEAGEFHEALTRKYFDKWYDRFFLIGGDRPFYQVPAEFVKEMDVKPDKKKNPSGKLITVAPYEESDKLGWIGAAAFNGEILQSGNSLSPFADKGIKKRQKMALDEAARWLIYYQNYADCSSKIPGKWNAGMTFTSSGANIHPIGHNLFETIMLCSVLLDVNQNIYPDISPAWEKDSYNSINYSPYGEAQPDNLPELYTQQSRKAIIHFNGSSVDGMFVAAGDRYGATNAFIEPMFAFHPDSKDKSGMVLRPNHLPNNSVGWKEYRATFMESKAKPARWVQLLFEEDILDFSVHIPYFMSDIAYGSMQCSVTYTTNTRLILSSAFFTDMSEIERASSEINNIEEISHVLKLFGERLDSAFGASRSSNGKMNSIFRDQMVRKYELEAGLLIEKLLAGDITDMAGFHNDIVKTAEAIAEEALTNVSLTGFVGHGNQSIGRAEDGFNKDIYQIRKKLDKKKEEVTSDE